MARKPILLIVLPGLTLGGLAFWVGHSSPASPPNVRDEPACVVNMAKPSQVDRISPSEPASVPQAEDIFPEEPQCESAADITCRRPDVSGGRNDSLGVGGGSGAPHGARILRIRRGSGPRPAPPRAPEPPPAGPRFDPAPPNPWHDSTDERLSTFAVDVDTASYTYARRCLREGRRPEPESVRTEEFVNYFPYAYPSANAHPFTVALEAAPSPFTAGRHVLRIGLQGRTIAASERKPARLTFLVDTSGSMQGPDRLGLVQRSLELLVDNLQPTDSVAISTYAGSVREVLRPTGVEDVQKIKEAIRSLSAGGSTAMASGIELAYRLAEANFVEGTVNRVILCSDGDANVGASSPDALLALIAKHRAKGITLTTVGVGCGNYRDAVMEKLADKGDGHYVYVDSLKQARRVFKDQLAGTLQVIAKDVKVQVELGASVRSWRLVGYENRRLANEQFRDDKVDAGEIGSGHAVTALYELVLAENPAGPLATVRVRHKTPDAKPDDTASEDSFAIEVAEVRPTFESASADFRFAVAAAAFAEVLREAPEARTLSLDRVLSIAAAAATTTDREELLLLIQQAVRRAG